MDEHLLEFEHPDPDTVGVELLKHLSQAFMQVPPGELEFLSITSYTEDGKHHAHIIGNLSMPSEEEIKEQQLDIKKLIAHRRALLLKHLIDDLIKQHPVEITGMLQYVLKHAAPTIKTEDTAEDLTTNFSKVIETTPGESKQRVYEEINKHWPHFEDGMFLGHTAADKAIILGFGNLEYHTKLLFQGLRLLTEHKPEMVKTILAEFIVAARDDKHE